jgi:hypothetical protein
MAGSRVCPKGRPKGALDADASVKTLIRRGRVDQGDRPAVGDQAGTAALPSTPFSVALAASVLHGVRPCGWGDGLVLIPVDELVQVPVLVGLVVNVVRGASPLEAILELAAGAPGGPKV